MNQWSLQTLIDVGTRAFFGKAFLQLLPDLSSVFEQWDEHSYKIVYHYPAFLSYTATASKAKLVNALIRYFELPREERSDACPYVLKQEEEARHAGLSTEDLARLVMTLF